MMPELKTSETSEKSFRERITSIDRRRVGDILRNERNPKRYTDEKTRRLTAVLSQFGKAGVLLTYFDPEGVERFFDGNTRRGIDPDDVWYIAQTDLTQKEVDDLVMLYDPLAEPDWEPELLKMLAEETAVEGGVFGDMLDEILEELGAGNLFQPTDPANDPYAEWEGMPEFEQEDKTSYQAIYVHFKNAEEVAEFGRLLNQSLTDKTRSIWFSQREKMLDANERYSA